MKRLVQVTVFLIISLFTLQAVEQQSCSCNTNGRATTGNIDPHLLFSSGASYLVPAEMLDKYGWACIGRPDGQFIIPSTEMDRLLAPYYYRTGIPWRTIQQALNITGTWSDVVYRVDIPYSELDCLHIREASEANSGANSEFVPGANKTKGGYDEAVIDPIPRGTYSIKQHWVVVGP